MADVIPMRRPDGRTVGSRTAVGRSLGRTVTRTRTSVGDALTSTIGAAVSSIGGAASDGLRSAARRLTEEAAGAVDDWGRDPALVRNVMFASRLRWDVSTGGDQRLPRRRGALIAVNSPRWMMTPIFTAFAISEAVDRPVRFVGRSDGDPIGSMARRLGGLLDHPDELAGALRAGELVVIGARHSPGPRDVGEVDHTLVGAAIAAGVKVFPAATSSSPFARRARVEIGTETRPPSGRRGPLTELELAQKLRRDIRALLDEMGDISTGTPLDWLPFSGLGAH